MRFPTVTILVLMIVVESVAVLAMNLTLQDEAKRADGWKNVAKKWQAAAERFESVANTSVGGWRECMDIRRAAPSDPARTTGGRE